MTLIARIQTLSERGRKLVELESKRAESSRLQELRDTLKPLKKALADEVAQMRLLQDEGIHPNLDTGAATNGRAQVDKLLQRFGERRRAESLTRGNNWTRCEEEVKAATKNISDALRVTWHQFVDSAHGGESPNDLAGSLPQTELNLELLKRYREAYRELRGQRKTRPAQRADFDRVRELARQLSEIGQRFERDVPADVDRFLRAVNAGDADLDLLTPEVMDWLRAQNKTDRFRIIARNPSS